MTDISLEIEVGAVVVSAVVALTAVYLGYRFQLKSMRSDRMLQSFSDAMWGVQSALATLVVLSSVAPAFAESSSWTPDETPTREQVAFVMASCRAARSGLGEVGEWGPDIPSEEDFGESFGGEETDAVQRFALQTKHLVVHEFEGAYDRIFRASISAYLAGASSADRDSIFGLARKMHEVSSTIKGPSDLDGLAASAADLESRLRRAVEK